jgi:hypothetical protein
VGRKSAFLENHEGITLKKHSSIRSFAAIWHSVDTRTAAAYLYSLPEAATDEQGNPQVPSSRADCSQGTFGFYPHRRHASQIQEVTGLMQGGKI